MNTESPNTYQIFKDYAQQFERHKTDVLFLPQIFAKIITQVQGNILDIGTGDGHKLETILRAVPKQKINKIIALEPSPLAKEASERLRNYLVQIQDSAIEDLKGYSDYFHCILMFEVLEHLPDQRIILKQILKLLHPDGVLILSTPNRPIYNFTERIAGKELDPTHCSVLTCRQIKNLIKDYFKKVEFYGVLPLAMKLTRRLGLTKGALFPNLPLFSADIFCFARDPLKSNLGG
jgi:2-polyprenyl-3-methyl-5-hydroxy-6-metoxy-1,4-benzoquinol methylase